MITGELHDSEDLLTHYDFRSVGWTDNNNILRPGLWEMVTAIFHYFLTFYRENNQWEIEIKTIHHTNPY